MNENTNRKHFCVSISLFVSANKPWAVYFFKYSVFTKTLFRYMSPKQTYRSRKRAVILGFGDFLACVTK